MEPDGDGTLAAAAATSAARQLDQGDDERQEQLTEAAGPAVPEQAERGFPKFLLLPPEIQNMVWNEALDIVPRVHILVSRDRHLAPDALQGQALQDAADVDKLENHPGLQDEMNTLVAACQALGERHSFGWSVPGCTKYRPSFDTISSTLSQVCTESRRVFQEYRERRTMTRLMKWSKLSVDERDSISAFATRRTPGIQQRQQPRGSWRRRRDSHPRSWPSSSRFTQTIEPSEGSLPTFRLNCRCG